jgi:nucleotide-binding universal stress UspA family protein
MFKQITAALDGSPNSIKALDYAAHIASQDNATLQIISVIEPLPVIYGGASTAAYNEANQLGMEKNYQKIQTEQRARLKKQYQKLKITTIIKEGRPSTKITESALDSDLIVIGHRGHGGVRNWILGSVAKQIVDQCTAPVLIIKDPDYCQA